MAEPMISRARTGRRHPVAQAGDSGALRIEHLVERLHVQTWGTRHGRRIKRFAGQPPELPLEPRWNRGNQVRDIPRCTALIVPPTRSSVTSRPRPWLSFRSLPRPVWLDETGGTFVAAVSGVLRSESMAG